MTTIIASFGVATTSLLLSILITIKRPLGPPERWLALWLTSQDVFWIATLASVLGISNGALLLLMIGQLALFSSGAAQYLYTAAALKVKVSYSIPVIATASAAALLLSPVYFGLDTETLNGGIVVNEAPWWVFGVPIACLLLGAAFPFGALRLIAAYESRAKGRVSNFADADPAWLRIWALTSIAVHALLLAAVLVSNIGIAPPEVSICTGLVLQLGSICFVAHRSLTRPGAFLLPVAHERPAINLPDPVQSRADAALLERHFEMAKPHLSPELTARELADGLGWAPERLTAALRHDGLTFFDAVNRKRVRELQAMLLNPANKHGSLLILAHSAGFGSKSALYTAFRRHAGCSPAVWRQRLKHPRCDQASEMRSA